MKPILFSTPMVQALLNTKPGVWPAEPIDPEKPFKSMTRRVMKHEPLIIELDGEPIFAAPSRIGKGDLLWVRETWLKDVEGTIYKADLEDWQLQRFNSWNYKWKSPRYMPREAARIFLEVKSVRVERVQDITIGDVQAEGIAMDEPPAVHNAKMPEGFDKMSKAEKDSLIKTLARHTYMADLDYVERHINKYAKLWDKLNAKRGYPFESSPWVWVYEFMRVEK